MADDKHVDGSIVYFKCILKCYIQFFIFLATYSKKRRTSISIIGGNQRWKE